MKIIKTYENYNLDDLDLGRFSERINKNLLIPNTDGTYDYDGDLNFSDMGGLTSLLEIPIRFRNVSGRFDCSTNNLYSLKGSPVRTGNWFDCSANFLISLQYAPINVKVEFISSWNYLISTARLSNGDVSFVNDGNSIRTKNDVIEIVKKMTFGQQMEELDFFEKYDSFAFKIMKEILDTLGVNYGPETRNMVDRVKDKENLNVIF